VMVLSNVSAEKTVLPVLAAVGRLDLEVQIISYIALEILRTKEGMSATTAQDDSVVDHDTERKAL
jgi:hypothetical protein